MNLKAPTFVEKYFYKPLKTFPHITGAIKVLNIHIDENMEELCSKIKWVYNKAQNICCMNKEEVCKHPKTRQDMERYIGESFDSPITTFNSRYAFVDNNLCGYVWDFYSRGGEITLKRTMTNNEKIISIT